MANTPESPMGLENQESVIIEIDVPTSLGATAAALKVILGKDGAESAHIDENNRGGVPFTTESAANRVLDLLAREREGK